MARVYFSVPLVYHLVFLSVDPLHFLSKVYSTIDRVAFANFVGVDNVLLVSRRSLALCVGFRYPPASDWRYFSVHPLWFRGVHCVLWMSSFLWFSPFTYLAAYGGIGPGPLGPLIFCEGTGWGA